MREFKSVQPKNTALFGLTQFKIKTGIIPDNILKGNPIFYASARFFW